MMVVFWPAAEADIAEAMAWYDARSDGLGRAVFNELESCLARISAGPGRYPMVHGSTRRALLRRFPYAVYFREDGDRIVIFAVLHQRRSSHVLRTRTNNPPRL